MYAFGMVATTAAMGVSPAYAQRGRGRGYGRGYGYGRGAAAAAIFGAAIGIGVGAAIIGGAIAAGAAQQQQNSVNYCMQRFRSYNPRAGPIWLTTATAVPVRDETIACTFSGPRPSAGVLFSLRRSG